MMASDWISKQGPPSDGWWLNAHLQQHGEVPLTRYRTLDFGKVLLKCKLIELFISHGYNPIKNI